ncbi:MAG: hypothetical protein IH991_05605, partial [Planctomycetes bacterium]|nr:hypothetical protein [Planctomycetota bacterium]
MSAQRILCLISVLMLFGCGKDNEPATTDASKTDQSAVVTPNADRSTDKDREPEPRKGDDSVTLPANPERSDTQTIKPLNLAFIPENSAVAVFIHPQRIAKAPAIQSLLDDPFVRDELLPRMFQFGFHPLDVDELVVTLATPLPAVFGQNDEPLPPLEQDPDQPKNPVDGFDGCQQDEPSDEPETTPAEPAKPSIDEPDFSNLFEGLEPVGEAKDPELIEKSGPPPILIPVNLGVVVRFAEAEKAAAFVKKFKAQMTEGTSRGKTYLRQDVLLDPELASDNSAGLLSVHIADEKTVVFADEAMLLKMMAAADVNSRLVKRLQDLDANNDLVGAVDLVGLANDKHFENLVSQLESPELQSGFAELKGLSISVDLGGKTMLQGAVAAKSTDDAADFEQLVRQAIDQCKQGISKTLDGDLSPGQALPMELARALLEGSEIALDSQNVRFTLRKPDLFDDLPEILRPILTDLKSQAQWSKRVSGLQQVAAALNAYVAFQAELYGKPAFPSAFLPSVEGKPLLSWRVMLLPFLGAAEEDLYRHFYLDEPWDSEKNKKLLDSMPEVFGKMPAG